MQPTDNHQSLEENESDSKKDTRLPLFHIILSVLAAAFGVQSKKNLEKDFTAKGSIYIYIAAGVIFTTLFVVSVALVVKMVLGQAGG